MNAARSPRRRRRWLCVAAAATCATAAAVIALDRLLPPPLAAAADLSTVVVDRRGEPLRVFANAEGRWRLPAAAGDVAPVYLDMLLAREDRRFFAHPGIDPFAIGRALRQNLAAGHVVSGASTLTMQVARLLEPRPRDLKAKLIEMARALQLEARLSKRRILELYLTLAPFGGPLEGVRAASLSLFGKEPRELTAGEAALLVALPQSPAQLRPDRAPDEARTARGRVLDRAVAASILSAAHAAEAAAEPIPDRLRPWPIAAAHLGERLRREARGRPEIATTIDGRLQRATEALARREVTALIERAGLAVLVVDNRNREILVHLGAPDYLDGSRNGWIDMTSAPRSPGSALKPFIYGIAFDDRLVRPETIVADVSTSFGGYAPRNFDAAFHGELSVREALQRSLNVPAVLLLERIGPERFAAALTRAGAHLAWPRDGVAPGLPLALGGVGITLSDLTMLYVALARGGEAAPLKVVPADGETRQRTLMSPAAAAEVRGILEGASPPPGEVQAADRLARRTIAMKTGTSYGFRDAWAVGVSRQYTVGVWIGRPDGTPSPDHLGRTTAAPLLYKVFDLLPGEPAAPPAAAASPSSVPALLRRIEAGAAERQRVRLPDAERLHLIFPQAGTVLEVSDAAGTALAPVMLEASGGRRPLTWLVDGRPLAQTIAGRAALWQPERPGPARIAVIDANGRSASAEITIR